MIRRQLKKTKNQKQTTTQSSHSSRTVQPVELTFIEHLYELRSRLFWIVTSVVLTSAIGFQYKDYLVNFVIAPLHGEKLVYLTPGGGFSFIFTVCLYFGALITIPVIVYHIYRFLQPVLGTTSRRFIVGLITLSSALAASGAVFGYVVAVPAAIHFLSTFAGDAVIPNLTAESYLGFIVAYMLGLAALFQLPLLLFIFDHVRPFPPGALLTSQRFVIVGSFIAAAIITPTPDIINQLIVAGPIILIYQLGALAVFVRRKVRIRRQRTNTSTQHEVLAEERIVRPTVAQTAPIVAVPTVQTPMETPVNTQNITSHPPKRSIDGFASHPRSHAPRANPVVSRPLPSLQTSTRPERLQPNMPQTAERRLRSIDGLSNVA